MGRQSLTGTWQLSRHATHILTSRPADVSRLELRQRRVALKRIALSGLGKAVKRLTNHAGDAEVAIIYRKSENTGKVFISE